MFNLLIFKNSLSVYDKSFGMEEVEKLVMGKVEEVAKDPPIHRRPRSRFNYELFKNLSWIFGLLLILGFIFARWSTKHDEPIVKEKVIIIPPEVRNESYDFFFDSKELSFLWRFCNRTTYNCSWCPPGWTEYDSWCYHMFNYTETWKNAQAICNQCLGDLPVVLNEQLQIFLSIMAAEYTEQNRTVQGVWIGLSDTEKEGQFTWVNGQRLVLKYSFWQPDNPNNMCPVSDKSGENKDCVAIVPRLDDQNPEWYHTWDDKICNNTLHFICEIPLFLTEAENYMT